MDAAWIWNRKTILWKPVADTWGAKTRGCSGQAKLTKRSKNLRAQQNQGSVTRSFVAVAGNVILYTAARNAKQCEMCQLFNAQGET